MLKYIFVILRKFAVSPMTILIEWPSSLKTEIETDTEMWAHVSTHGGVARARACVCVCVCVCWFVVGHRTWQKMLGSRLMSMVGFFFFLYRHIYALFKENFWGMKLWKEAKWPVITSSFNTATIYSMYLLPTFFFPLDFCSFKIIIIIYVCVLIYIYILFILFYSFYKYLNIYSYSLLFLPKMKK